jgi:hypothetical protein
MKSNPVELSPNEEEDWAILSKSNWTVLSLLPLVNFEFVTAQLPAVQEHQHYCTTHTFQHLMLSITSSHDLLSPESTDTKLPKRRFDDEQLKGES